MSEVHLLGLLFGLLVGSFLNVVIYRLPRKQEIVIKRSHCPSCGKKILWYQNIPLLSYLFLRGKCEKCGARISWRYPLVELLTGLGAFYFIDQYFIYGEFFQFFFFFSLFCCFICHFFIDLEHQLLLDKINLLLLAIILPFVILFRPWAYWLIGGVIGFGLTYAITWTFYLIKGKIGLGGGDIKLYGILGLFLGPIGILQNIFLSCFLGSLIGGGLIISRVITRDHPIAFGPFILVVASFQIFFPKTFHSLMSGLGLAFL